MRTFELVLLVLVLFGCVRATTSRAARSPGVAAALALTTLLVLAVHLGVEQPRWQLVPLYLAVTATTTSAALAVARERTTRAPRGRWIVVGVLGVAGAAVAAALPVPALPPPAGDLPVGTSVVSLTDRTRVEHYGDGEGPRQVVAQVWYPADPDTAVRPAPWVPTGRRFGRLAADRLDLPPFALDHVGLVRSHATADAPPAEGGGRFPVVIYAHGWSGFRTIQSDLAESLASRGYVVAALDHTYGALVTQRPDGELVPLDPDALPAGLSGPEYDEAAARLVATFAADLGFLLDRLEAGAVAELRGRLALDAVGVVGHSTGGGAAVALCADDPRCAAVVGYDPWVEPVPDAVLGRGLDVPILSMRSAEWVGNGNDARLRRLHAASGDDAGLVAVDGTTHRDVTLLPYLSPLSSAFGVAGDTPGGRTHELTEVWTARFLDTHLRGRDVDPLLDPPSFEEATLDG